MFVNADPTSEVRGVRRAAIARKRSIKENSMKCMRRMFQGSRGTVVALILFVVAGCLVDWDREALGQTSGGPFAYISKFADHTVSVIDTATNMVIANITGPPETGFCGIHGIAVNPGGARLYFGHVPECGGGPNVTNVVVVDTATNAVIATAEAGAGVPLGIAVDPSGTRELWRRYRVDWKNGYKGSRA